MGIPLVALMGTSSTHPLQPDNLISDVAGAQQIAASRAAVQNRAALLPGELQEQGIRNQLGQQAIQSGALDLAQRSAINDAWKQAATRNPDGSVALDPNGLANALALSGHGEAIPAITKGLLDMQEQKDKIAASRSALSAQEADAAGAGAQAVLAANGDPNVISAFLQHMKDAGYGQQASMLQQHLQGLPQDQQLGVFKSLVAASPKQQSLAIEQATAQAKAQEAATAAKKEAFEESQGGTNVDMREMKDWLNKNPDKGPSDFLVWKAQHSPTLLAAGNFGGPQGDPMVDMVGQGRVDLQTVLQRLPGAAKQAFLTQLNAKYPGFQQQNYAIEKKVGEEFTSGDAAKNLTAFNTAIEHANQLSKAADALQNGDVRGLNAIGNALGYQFGSDKTTNFNVIKNALSGEISKVFKGGQATDAEIKQVEAPFSSANSPAQLQGAIKNAITLMNSKRDALQQQYQAGIQAKPNFGGGQQAQHKPGGQATGLTEGQTGTGSDGKKYVVKGGVWVAQ